MMASAGAVYVVSVYQAYQSGGNWLVVAIPLFGQIVWFVVRWHFFGLLNNYTYICLAFIVFGTWFNILNEAWQSKRSPTPEEQAERNAFPAEHWDDIERIAADVKARESRKKSDSSPIS